MSILRGFILLERAAYIMLFQNNPISAFTQADES